VFFWCVAAVGVQNGVFGAQVPGFLNAMVQFAGLHALAMALPGRLGPGG